jgi:predicted metal-binding membrane protein
MLAVAAAAWFVAVQRMQGMGMGAASELGSLSFFVGVWVAMMAAMMLPGAVPAVVRRARADGPAQAVLLFAGSYLAVWALAGLVVFVVYRPHGSAAAGALTVAAGVYELTPFKRDCRRRCRENVHSGVRFGFYCVGSSIGLMVLQIALGVMSVSWMAIVAAVIVTQKLLPPRQWLDVPLALAIVGLGVLVVLAPGVTTF